MYALYRIITQCVSPVVPWWLRRRLARGKEDAGRLPERLGRAGQERPPGKLVWIHAASVGEANAVLPLIEAMLDAAPFLHVLLTTVTVTSARLMASQLPPRALHQFAPVDTLHAAQGFLNHWQPDVALWVDSELWPNLVLETRRRKVVMGIINARMSERSFRRWKMARPLIRRMLGCFDICFAQSEADASRLQSFGVPAITGMGNLKYDALPLPYDSAQYTQLRSMIGSRPVWLAASTHPGEEEYIARVHNALASEQFPLLTIIVPRHAVRGDEVAARLSPSAVAQRSQRALIAPETAVYIADTMGELGLWYRLAPVTFMGGSLVPHGGQNPLEAARLGCTILAGPHTENFADIYRDLDQKDACVKVKNETKLVETLRLLLTDTPRRQWLAENALTYVQSHGGVTSQIMNQLQPYLT